MERNALLDRIIRIIRESEEEHNSLFFNFRVFLRSVDQYLLDTRGYGLPFYDFLNERSRIQFFSQLSQQELERLVQPHNDNQEVRPQPHFEQNSNNQHTR